MRHVPVNAKSIERGISFTLAENSYTRAPSFVDLYVDLSTLAIILRLHPNFLGLTKMA